MKSCILYEFLPHGKAESDSRLWPLSLFCQGYCQILNQTILECPSLVCLVITKFHMRLTVSGLFGEFNTRQCWCVIRLVCQGYCQVSNKAVLMCQFLFYLVMLLSFMQGNSGVSYTGDTDMSQFLFCLVMLLSFTQGDTGVSHACSVRVSAQFYARQYWHILSLFFFLGLISHEVVS